MGGLLLLTLLVSVAAVIGVAPSAANQAVLSLLQRRQDGGEAAPLEEVLKLFNQLLEQTRSELTELDKTHETNLAAANAQLSAVETQYLAEKNKCDNVEANLASLNNQLNEANETIAANTRQIATNQENLNKTYHRLCSSNHDFVLSLKDYREGIELLTLVRKLVSDHWAKQSKTGSLLEDHHITQLVSSLLPKLIQARFVQEDPAFKDIVEFVQKNAPKEKSELELLIERDQPRIRMRSFDTTFSTTEAQIAKLLEALDRVIAKNKAEMEKLIAFTIDHVIETDRYTLLLEAENVRLAKNNEELLVLIETLKRRIVNTENDKVTCLTSVDNAHEMVLDAEEEVELLVDEYKEHRKVLEENESGILELMKLYKRGVYESSTVRAKVQEELAKKKQGETPQQPANETAPADPNVPEAKSLDGANATDGAQPAGAPTEGAPTNPPAEGAPATPPADGAPVGDNATNATAQPAAPAFLLDVVSCDSPDANGNCGSMKGAFSQFVQGSCMKIPGTAKLPVSLAYIYYQLNGDVFTAVFDSNGSPGEFLVGACPCGIKGNSNDSSCDNGLEFAESTYTGYTIDARSRQIKRFSKPITNKLNSLVKSNTLHMVQPQWRNLAGQGNTDGTDYEVNLHYRLGGNAYALQAADSMSLGIGSVPIKSDRMRLSRGMMACDSGSYELLSAADMASRVHNGNFLELCYDDSVKAREQAGACKGERRLCFELAYDGKAHTACVKPNYCFRFGKAPQ
eukprot:TRINITY_DN96_c0_g2_i2.p1 TRINITY_DN96_c0_g2~~TRINITY_DN96_c0_g2_i2.p1  ORF type:complete len:743 (+),score=238.44 TRINITY_DN96_c0_g2_i2:40-2268(+)